MKIRVTKDKEKADEIRKALRENYGFCPCMIERTPANLCPCDEFMAQEESGECHCGLYVKETMRERETK